MMKVRIFMGSRPDRVEEQINHWLASQAATAYIAKTETALAPVTERREDGAQPCIVVTIWFELPAS